MLPNSQVSDDTVDALVELFFVALPAMDASELALLLNAVLQLVARERRQAVVNERDRLLQISEN